MGFNEMPGLSQKGGGMVEGFLAIDKPEGPSSHDIVAMVRRLIHGSKSAKGDPKTGHCGTLDPFASGLLVLAIGKATRFTEYLLHGDKTYEFALALGATSDTYDRTGAITKSGDGVLVESLTMDKIQSALLAFTGEIEQKPPIFSAVKIKGRKLYEYARSGEDVAIKPRRVVIRHLRLLSMETPHLLHFEARVSGGVYIRSLGHDIGQRLGVGAYVHSLRRTAIGDIALSQSISLGHLESQWRKKMISIPDIFKGWERAVLSGEDLARIQSGNYISAEDGMAISAEKKNPLLLLDASGDVIALAEIKMAGDGARRLIQPFKVFKRF